MNVMFHSKNSIDKEYSCDGDHHFGYNNKMDEHTLHPLYTLHVPPPLLMVVMELPPATKADGAITNTLPKINTLNCLIVSGAKRGQIWIENG